MSKNPEDRYSQEQYQKFLQKKKSATQADAVTEDIQKRAVEIERENLKMAQQARMKLESAKVKQKETTTQLQSQEEKLKKSRKDAEEIYKGSKKGAKITEDIKEEGKLIRFRIPFVKSIKRFFSKEKKMDEDVKKELKKTISHENLIDEDENEVGSFNSELGATKEEVETNKELYEVYKNLKEMKGQAALQEASIKRSNLEIGKISKLNENSEHIMNKTTAELKKT